MPQPTNAAGPEMCSTSQRKFWLKNTGEEGQRQKHRGQHRQPFHGGVLPRADPCLVHRDDRNVGLCRLPR